MLGIAAFACFLLIYIVLWSMFIVPNDTQLNRAVIGYEFNPQIRDMMSELPPRSPEQWLRKFDRDVYAIWTPTSIRVASLLVISSWLALWASIALALGSFTAIQYRRVMDKPKRRSKSKATASES